MGLWIVFVKPGESQLPRPDGERLLHFIAAGASGWHWMPRPRGNPEKCRVRYSTWDGLPRQVAAVGVLFRVDFAADVVAQAAVPARPSSGKLCDAVPLAELSRRWRAILRQGSRSRFCG